MASRFSLLRLRSYFLRATGIATGIATRSFHTNPLIFPTIKSDPLIICPLSDLRTLCSKPHCLSALRFFSIARRQPVRPKTVDIGKRARQLQARRLWTYALAFSGVAGFIVVVLNNFQDQLTFYVTPTDAMEKYRANPEKTRFRLGGLVLEGSVLYPDSSAEMEFVITDLMTDILVRYEGSLPDLFREGHSVVVEGFVKPLTEELREKVGPQSVSAKARSQDCYFSAIEVLAKHDEKYMPQEVAAAIEKNKKLIEGAQVVGVGGAYQK